MSPLNKKGAAFESAVRDYLRQTTGLPVERVPAGMAADRGDLSGVPDHTVEVKCYADQLRGIREGLADLEVEQANADTPYGVVIAKRRGKADVGSALVVCELWQWAALMRHVYGKPAVLAHDGRPAQDGAA